MTRFAKPSDTLSEPQKAMVRALGASSPRQPQAVPHRLIAGPMKAKRYKPEPWHVPIR